MRERALQRLLRSARRTDDGYYTRALIVGALKRAYAAGRRGLRIDRHAVSEAARFLEDQRTVIEIAHGEGFENGSRSGRIRGLGQALRHTHYDEMARRLRRMLSTPRKSK